MKGKNKLSKKMTIAEFDAGYWYADDLKSFAKDLGIPAVSKLRKDEIEKAVKNYLKTGKATLPTKRKLSKGPVKDSEAGLSFDLKVVNYTNNKETKGWIVAKAKELDPNFRERSGARLRLNRWREEQVTKGNDFTYGDLVRQYLKINDPKTKYTKYPSGRYINFLSDYLKKEKGASREEAVSAWHELKNMDIPKTYSAWKRVTAPVW